MSQQNDYQFVMIPQQLSSCLDANCHKMLSTLIGLNSIMSNEDGWFFRSNKDLQLDVRLSENLIRATLDTLYQAGIINIDCIGKGRGHRTNRIHINFESFKRYEKYSFNEIRNNPDLWIETVKYKDHFVPSYMKCEKVSTSYDKCEEVCESKCEGLCECICEKVSTNTDTTDTTNTTDIKEININNKEEMSFEEFTEELKKLCYVFINRHPEYNYLLDVDCFKNNYFENVYKFQTYVNNELNRDIPIDDYCLLLLNYANQEQKINS